RHQRVEHADHQPGDQRLCEELGAEHGSHRRAGGHSDVTVSTVMPCRGPGIHVFRATNKTWMAGTPPGQHPHNRATNSPGAAMTRSRTRMCRNVAYSPSV